MNHWVAMSSFYFIKDAYEAALWASENSFAGIELWADVPFLFVDAVKPGVLKKIGRINNLRFSLHSPIYGINISSVNPGIMAESIRQVRRAVTWSKYLNIERVIIHPGDSPSSSVDIKNKSIAILKDSVSSILEEAGESAPEILIENIAINSRDTLSEIDGFVSFLDSSNLCCCLDAGHANIRWGLERTVSSLKDYVREVHVSDNDSLSDMHLPAGDGIIDWSPLKELALMDIPFVHEVRDPDDLAAGLIRSRSCLEKCFT